MRGRGRRFSKREKWLSYRLGYVAAATAIRADIKRLLDGGDGAAAAGLVKAIAESCLDWGERLVLSAGLDAYRHLEGASLLLVFEM